MHLLDEDGCFSSRNKSSGDDHVKTFALFEQHLLRGSEPFRTHLFRIAALARAIFASLHFEEARSARLDLINGVNVLRCQRDVEIAR